MSTVEGMRPVANRVHHAGVREIGNLDPRAWSGIELHKVSLGSVY